jgi:hypothetical protein
MSMKGLKITATIAIMAIILYSFISSFNYYTRFFTGSPLDSLREVLSFFNTILIILEDILLLVLGFIFLLSQSVLMKDKAYRLFRFVVVMMAILYVPLNFYWIFFYPQNWLFYVIQAVDYFAVIVLLIAPPENPIKRIDLTNYEMVAFTSGGHRFVHILLDRLFLLPFWLAIYETLIYRSSYFNVYISMLQIFVVLSYLLYCFLSEAIFRQTFGKILTGSVVVSNGVKLSTGRILLRTIARLIPFDAISFLFGANWHDKTTSTAVVYNNTWEKAFEESQ